MYQSHIYKSLNESFWRTALLGLMIGASILCLKPNEASSTIGGAISLYVLSIAGEVAPNVKDSSNLLKRIYIAIISIWVVVMLMVCGYLIWGQPELNLKILKNATYIPFLIYLTDMIIYFLWGKKYKTSIDKPEKKLKEMEKEN